jgi:hypothetical protein
MKVRMTIDLELPDKYNDWTKPELQQLLFDEYVNHATCSHFEDALNWCASWGNNQNNFQEKMIYESHSEWGRICSGASFDFEVIK